MNTSLYPSSPNRVQPGMLTGGDLSDIPLPQLGQFAQQDQNPALKSAAMMELAKRGAADRSAAMHDPSSPMTPLGNVAAGTVTMPGQQPAQQPDAPVNPAYPDAQSIRDNPPVLNPSDTNPAMDAIATGSVAADATAGQVPSYVDQGFATSGAGAATNTNPALAAAATPSSASTIGDLMKNVPTEITSQDKWLALAKGFATMASSRQPGLLGAIGEGAGAATDALRQDQDQAIRNRIFGVEAGQRQEGIEESGRSNRVQEGQGDQRLQIAKASLDQAQQQFQFEQKKYEQGLGSEQALKLAQIAAAQASTEYSRVAAQVAAASSGQIVQTDQGLGQVSGSKFTPIQGPNGQPVNQTYRPTAAQDKLSILTSAGVPPAEAALIVAGQKAPTAVQIETAASNAGKNASAGLYGDAASIAYQQEYARVKAELSGGAPAAAAPPPAAAQPGASAAPAAAIPSPKTRQEYDAIPPGQKYVDTDGQTKIKK